MIYYNFDFMGSFGFFLRSTMVGHDTAAAVAGEFFGAIRI